MYGYEKRNNYCFMSDCLECIFEGGCHMCKISVENQFAKYDGIIFMTSSSNSSDAFVFQDPKYGEAIANVYLNLDWRDHSFMIVPDQGIKIIDKQ